jgi:hypothetical protein
MFANLLVPAERSAPFAAGLEPPTASARDCRHHLEASTEHHESLSGRELVRTDMYHQLLAQIPVIAKINHVALDSADTIPLEGRVANKRVHVGVQICPTYIS